MRLVLLKSIRHCIEGILEQSIGVKLDWLMGNGFIVVRLRVFVWQLRTTVDDFGCRESNFKIPILVAYNYKGTIAGQSG